jgi:hypothetical protein
MSVTCDQVKAYATQFLPQFQFADTEQVYPVTVDSYLTQCAQGDWQSATDAHRGTTVVQARVPLTLGALFPLNGCRGVTTSGPVGTPIDPTKPLPTNDALVDEFFIDYAGWFSLTTGDGFVKGDDAYIRAYFWKYFSMFRGELSQAGPTPPTRTVPTMPTAVTVYCEAAWAGDFTRASIANKMFDFAEANGGGPDPRLDKYFVLSYYLFYPCTMPPPPNSQLSADSPNNLYREGQWEAVSFYINAGSAAAPVTSAADLVLPKDPSSVTPDFAVLSNGITSSGDGQSPQIALSYPANVGSWSQGGQTVYTGGFPSYGKELVPQSVYVTSGTHKNLFSPTPTTTTSSPDPGWAATGGALEGGGGLVAGSTGGTGIGLIIGLIMLLIGFLMQLFGKDTTTTEQPDSQGDIASSNGPSAGPSPPPGGSSSYVATQLVTLSMLPNNPSCAPPAWWPFPGRWGVAMSSALSSWDSGARRVDYMQRSRAYWNTVWLQQSL